PEKAENRAYNHQQKAVAYTMDNNLFLAIESDPRFPIAVSKDENIISGQFIHRNEFGIQGGIFWSPKGNYIVFYVKDVSQVQDYPLVDINTTPATLKNIKYPMAGSKNEIAKIGVFDLRLKTTFYLKVDNQDAHYLTNLAWTPDEKQILLAEVKRSQDHYDLNTYSRETGEKIQTLWKESNPKWVEPETPALFIPNRNNEFVWLSEKDGFMNLYLGNTSSTKFRQLTAFKWVVQEVLGFDENGENVFIQGTGEDPRDRHIYSVNIRKGTVRSLTPKAGSHSALLSSNGRYLLDIHSALKTPYNVSMVEVASGASKTFYQAPNPLENYDVGTVEFVTLKADNGTPLYGKIVKPRDFDPKKKYPVLVYVYGGPHDQLVINQWNGATYPWMLAMAQNEQYLIFTLDNRGSENRGFAFESVIHRDLAKYAMKDQMKGVEYLKSLPYVDSKRMVVYGWSFGGFLASSLMYRQPGTFTTAIAGGAVIDWKFYEVMYGERYMDTPEENPEGYKDNLVTNYIKNLQGNILYIHGYIDPIVVPQHMLTISQAAINEGKVIHSFLYPNQEHNVLGNESIHLTKIIVDFILKNNVEQPENTEPQPTQENADTTAGASL
ncbi:MAG: DPP IV N-terminal domain-containing protein, partial [Capnocytophaga granulosa]